MGTGYNEYGSKLRPPHREVKQMMNKPDNENIIKRVYQSIKERVINYDVPPGERLNIEQLAEQLRVSTTPVRESLNRLVAEDLILMIPRMGFFMKSLMEPELRDLYELNQVLLDWSIVRMKKDHVQGADASFPQVSSIIDKLLTLEKPNANSLVRFTSDIFAYLASQSGNSEITLRVRNINDRLHFIRLCECEMMDSPVEQLLPLFQLFNKSQFDELAEALTSYHDDRLAMLPGVIKARNFSSQNVMDGYGSQVAWRS